MVGPSAPTWTLAKGSTRVKKLILDNLDCFSGGRYSRCLYSHTCCGLLNSISRSAKAARHATGRPLPRSCTHKSRLSGDRWLPQTTARRLRRRRTTAHHYSSGGSRCFMYSTAPRPYVSDQIGLRHKASTTARGASGRNPYQGRLQTTALHVAHDMSYRS